jgi:aspartate racemase
VQSLGVFMKTIGLIGGMSWESLQQYYSIMNQEVRNILGKSHSAKIIMYSFDFQEIENLQYAGKWIELKNEIYKAGEILKKSNVDFIVHSIKYLAYFLLILWCYNLLSLY